METRITYDRNTLINVGYQRPQHRPITQPDQPDQMPPQEVQSPQEEGKEIRNRS